MILEQLGFAPGSFEPYNPNKPMEIEHEALSLGSSFRLYDEEEGDRDKGAKGEQAEKERSQDQRQSQRRHRRQLM